MSCTRTIFIETIENTLWLSLERVGISNYVYIFCNKNNENTNNMLCFLPLALLLNYYLGHSLELNIRR